MSGLFDGDGWTCECGAWNGASVDSCQRCCRPRGLKKTAPVFVGTRPRPSRDPRLIKRKRKPL